MKKIIDKLLYVTAIFLESQPLLVDTTVTRGSIHLQVGDRGACLPHKLKVKWQCL